MITHELDGLEEELTFWSQGRLWRIGVAVWPALPGRFFDSSSGAFRVTLTPGATTSSRKPVNPLRATKLLAQGGRELAFARNIAKLARLNFISGQLLLRHRYFLAALAGLSLTAAFPKFDFAGAAWVAPALMLACAYRTHGRTAFRIGYVAGLTHHLTTLYWLLHIPVTGFPIFGWMAMSAFLALYPAAWVWLLAGRMGKGGWVRRSAWTLAGAAAWVALEMIRARFLSGFPWNDLGASQWRMLPLIQIASWTGVYGVSFIVVWMSLAMFSGVLAMFRHPTSRYVWISEIMLPLLALLMLFAAGMARLRQMPAETETLRVTFIQPAIPQTMIWDAGENTNRFRQLMELTSQALTNETDLLLWPEAALPEFNDVSFAAITNLIQTHQVEMIFGADDAKEKPSPTPGDRYDSYNAAFHFRPDGSLGGIYHKRHLVMFGEYIPVVRALPFVKWFTPITGGFTAGDRMTHFALERRTPIRRETNNLPQQAGTVLGAPRRIEASTLICFEDTFPHLVRESVEDDTDFLVNLTNNGWFGKSASQWQHAASAALRAVENGVPLLRCCNNGVTCWIDALGQIRELFRDSGGSEYGAGFVTWEIPIPAPGEKRTRTFYHQHGDWFGWSCVAVAGLWTLPRIARRKRPTVAS